MSNSNSTSSNARLIGVIAITATVSIASVLSFQAIGRTSRRQRLKAEVEDRSPTAIEDDLNSLLTPQENYNNSTSNNSINSSSNSSPIRKTIRKTSEHIIRESLARNYVYFGDEGMEKIRSSFVIIVGLGGVGSAAATMLVRSGVGRVRLIDFDQVSLSSLNVRYFLLIHSNLALLALLNRYNDCSDILQQL